MSLWFWFTFSRWLMMLSMFLCVCWPFACLSKNIFWNLSLQKIKNGFFVFSLWRFKVSLHILDTSPLSDIYMIFKYFPPSCGMSFHFLDGVGCLFAFLMVSFNAQKFYILIRSNLSIFFFAICVFGVISKNHYLTQGHKDLLLCFILRNW